MKLEHVAFNVTDPVKVAEWYVAHLGLVVVRAGPPPVHAHFLGATSGQPMLEFYHNPAGPAPDYAGLHPVVLHIAFEVDDIPAAQRRLVAAGATIVDEIATTSAGDQLNFLRDPWGLTIQLVKRIKRMLA